MIWKEKTNVGRVVYDRKKKAFGRSDVLRIYKRVGLRYYRVSTARMDSIIGPLEAAIESGVGWVFRGGSFGGAGVTREFGADPAGWPPRIVLIIEEY
ncbi:hypothetical protein ES705_42518 [subsurface metagenome]